MATVTTPTGDVLEGVTGQLLDYYRGEGYGIVEDDVAHVQFPRHFDGEKYLEPEPEETPVVESVEVSDQQDAEPRHDEVRVADEVGTAKRDRR